MITFINNSEALTQTLVHNLQITDDTNIIVVVPDQDILHNVMKNVMNALHHVCTEIKFDDTSLKFNNILIMICDNGDKIRGKRCNNIIMYKAAYMSPQAVNRITYGTISLKRQ